MKCKLNDKCEFGDLCQQATRHDSITVLGCSSYKSKKPLTNEEWLKKANTEQLTEELLAWWFDGANTYSQFGLFKWEIDEAKEKIAEWLKQPHTSKE